MPVYRVTLSVEGYVYAKSDDKVADLVREHANEILDDGSYDPEQDWYEVHSIQGVPKECRVTTPYGAEDAEELEGLKRSDGEITVEDILEYEKKKTPDPNQLSLPLKGLV